MYGYGISNIFIYGFSLLYVMTKIVSAQNAYELDFSEQLDKGVFLCTHQLPLTRHYELLEKQRLTPYLFVSYSHIPSPSRMIDFLPSLTRDVLEGKPTRNVASQLLSQYLSTIETISHQEIGRKIYDQERLTELVGRFFEEHPSLSPEMRSQTRVDLLGGVSRYPHEYVHKKRNGGPDIDLLQTFAQNSDEFGSSPLIKFGQLTYPYRRRVFTANDLQELDKNIWASNQLPATYMIADFAQGAKKVLRRNHDRTWGETAFLKTDAFIWRDAILSVYDKLRKPEDSKVSLFSEHKKS